MSGHNWVRGLKDPNDILEFYNHFLEEANDGHTVLVGAAPTAGTASLMVIDMQNDFMLAPPGLGDPPGRFNVANGESMAAALSGFIRKNAQKFHKIIFTRDTHPIDHCSFHTVGAGVVYGPFPPHCIINHEGSALHPSMMEFKDLPNADVIFKGCSPTADSFGAYPYKDNAYLKRRQLGTCCPAGDCEGLTGGFHLANPEKKWDKFPFTGVEQYPNTNDALLLKDRYSDATYAKISGQIGAPFTLEELIPVERSGRHTIFICGLAGDYCVKDTALNIAKELKARNLRDVDIVILQPYTRYAFLPLQYVGLYQVYKNAVLANTAKAGNTFSSISKPKDINHYLFQVGVKDQPLYKLLSKEEAAAAKEAVEAVKHPWTLHANGKPYLGRADNPAESNPGSYFAFLTPTKDIIADYEAAGIKILMDEPDLTAMVGGARRRRRRTHRRRVNRRKTHRRRA